MSRRYYEEYDEEFDEWLVVDSLDYSIHKVFEEYQEAEKEANYMNGADEWNK